MSIKSKCDVVLLIKYYQCKNFVELTRYINQRFEYSRVTKKLLKILKKN